MTADGVSEALAEQRSISRWVSPLLTVRVTQVVLWLFVVSGPVAAIVLATHVSELAGRLEVIGNEATVEDQIKGPNASIKGNRLSSNWADFFV